MTILKRTLATSMLSAAAFGGMVAAAAIPAQAAVCGFQGITSGNLGGGEDGKYEKARYTNCENSNQKIEVQYFYAADTMCVSPGETILYVNPQLGALTGAKQIGSC